MGTQFYGGVEANVMKCYIGVGVSKTSNNSVTDFTDSPLRKKIKNFESIL